MRSALVAALVLVAPAAFAQTIVLTLPGERDRLVKAEDSCDDTVRVTYGDRADRTSGLLGPEDLGDDRDELRGDARAPRTS